MAPLTGIDLVANDTGGAPPRVTSRRPPSRCSPISAPPPTMLVWGTGDTFFDISWAYWLRDTIPGATRVVTVDGGRLSFPEERPMDLVPHLKQHWAEVAAART